MRCIRLELMLGVFSQKSLFMPLVELDLTVNKINFY